MKIILKPKRDKPVQNRHPWIFSGAIQKIDGQPQAGDVVSVYDRGNNFLARGIFNPQSQIQVRLLTWLPDEPLTPDFWYDRVARAVAGRAELEGLPDTNAYRLVHSEADGLPGLIVDKYGDWLVIQFLSLAVEQYREDILTALQEIVQPKGIYERSDVEARQKEGLTQRRGVVLGDAPPEPLEISEHGYRFLVDLAGGHKTGFYLDQRENRRKSQPHLAEAEVLNVFAYTGGFAVYGAAVNAISVTNIDSSQSTLNLARENLSLNRFTQTENHDVVADAFQRLRDYLKEGRQFDTVILDPPKFVHHRGQLDRATRAYKDINMLGMRLLRPGGTLISFSCSGAVSADLFQKILFGASVDVQRDVQIIDRLTQSGDHPVALTCPESEYLKGLICRVW